MLSPTVGGAFPVMVRVAIADAIVTLGVAVGGGALTICLSVGAIGVSFSIALSPCVAL